MDLGFVWIHSVAMNLSGSRFCAAHRDFSGDRPVAVVSMESTTCETMTEPVENSDERSPFAKISSDERTSDERFLFARDIKSKQVSRTVPVRKASTGWYTNGTPWRDCVLMPHPEKWKDFYGFGTAHPLSKRSQWAGTKWINLAHSRNFLRCPGRVPLMNGHPCTSLIVFSSRFNVTPYRQCAQLLATKCPGQACTPVLWAQMLVSYERSPLRDWPKLYQPRPALGCASDKKNKMKDMNTHDIHNRAQVHIHAFPSELFTERGTACAHQRPAERRRRVDAIREARYALYEPQSGRAVLKANRRNA